MLGAWGEKKRGKLSQERGSMAQLVPLYLEIWKSTKHEKFGTATTGMQIM